MRPYVKLISPLVIINGPHVHIARTTYEHTVCCYRLSSVVCRSVCRYVCHTTEPCKNGGTDRDAVWVGESDGPKELCVTWGPDPT